jgi:hypothetical protein
MLRALPPLARYLVRTMPWVTLITGCLVTIAVFTILARVAAHDQATFWLDQGTVRLSLLPAAAALAFVPYVPFRPLTMATPVPAWVTPAGHLLLAAPVVALTCWAQLRIMAAAIPPHAPQDPHEPFYALIAQLIGWAAIIVAAAACAGRSRFADLGGAIAAPISFALIAVAWYAPITAEFLVRPPAIPRSVAIGWYAITAAALILTCAAMRDHWHRYTRKPAPAVLSAKVRAVAWLGLGVVLAAVYTRLSETSQLKSDSANILLVAGEMLHGNVLLHGWWASDVSFYTTEIPQYALLEAIFGAGARTAHIAAGMTYALTVLLAIALARSGAVGRAGRRTRTAIAGSVMIAPQLGSGVFGLDMSVGHIGTAVPLLLIWLMLDRADHAGWRPGRTRRAVWVTPGLTAVALAWVLVADPLVLVVGVVPLALASLTQFLRVTAGRGRLAQPAVSLSAVSLSAVSLPAASWRGRIRAGAYPLALAAAAGASWLLARAAGWVLSALGGYRVHALRFQLTPLGDLHDNLPALWKVLGVYGADFAGLTGAHWWLAIAHLASVAAVGAALLLAMRWFPRLGLVDQVLALAVAANLAGYLLTSESQFPLTEIAIIAPFGAALAARQLTPTCASSARKPELTNAAADTARVRATTAAAATAAIALALYTAGLGYELTRPALPMAGTRLASWLDSHHLSYGLSGYWTSSSVTVDSGGTVQVRALLQQNMQHDLWMADERWYDPATHYADFIVLDSQPGLYNHWVPPAPLIQRYFGIPAQVYQVGPYTVEVWRHNLLPDLPEP